LSKWFYVDILATDFTDLQPQITRIKNIIHRGTKKLKVPKVS